MLVQTLSGGHVEFTVGVKPTHARCKPTCTRCRFRKRFVLFHDHEGVPNNRKHLRKRHRVHIA